MANFIPIIIQEEEDRGRDILVGVERNNTSFFLPKINFEELYQLKENIDNFLKEYQK